jgi:hypothetical protein
VANQVQLATPLGYNLGSFFRRLTIQWAVKG